MGLEFSLEDLITQTAVGAGVGAVIGGAAGGGVGAVPGAVAGGVSGFLSYIAGYFGAKSAQGLFDLDEKEAEVVRNFIEIAMPASFGGKVAAGSRLAKLLAKTPTPIKEGMKYATFGLTTGYVVEPYITEDGEVNATKLLGIAGLSALGLKTARELAPLGIWGAYTARQITSVLSEGKYGAGVFVRPEDAWRPRWFKKLTGREVEIPKIGIEEDRLVVKARDYFTEGLFKSREQIAELTQELSDVASVFKKYGIEIGSPISRKLGERLFDPASEAERARIIRETLLEEGVPEAHIDEIAEAIRSLQRVSLKMADILAEVGGAGRHYLSLLGSESRVFQHVFGKLREEERPVIELRKLRGLGGEARMSLPSVASTKTRGLIRKSRSPRMMKALQEQLGKKKPSIGDEIFVDGRKWVYTRLKEGSPARWISEYDPRKEAPGRELFLDLTASLYRQISEDLGLVRQLQFYDFLRKAAEPMGFVSERPIQGFIRLSETGQSSVIKGWGSLTGKYVHPQLYRALRAYAEMHYYRPKFETLARVNYRWKAAFLSLNFKSYVNALLGNMMISFANGHDPSELVYHYFEGLGKKDGLYREAVKHGLLKATLRWEQVAQQEAKELKRILFPEPPKAKPIEAAKRSLDLFAKFTDYTAERWYSRVDELFRYGLYRKLRKEGLSEAEAYKIALEMFAYYGDLPVIVRSLRDTITPFISFQVRILPQILKAFLRNPERFVLTLAFVEGLQRQAYKEMYGENWKEGMRYEELVRPAYMETRIGGLMADFIRVPRMIFEDGTEIPSGYMYSGFIPWNIPLSVPHINTGTLENPLSSYLPILVIQNPILRFVSGLFMHIDPATGRKVYEIAGVDRPLASAFQYGMQTILPSSSLLKYPAQIWAREGFMDPIIAWFNYFGTYPTGEPVGTAHMLWNAVAPSVLKFDPQYNLEMSLKRLEALERGYKRSYYRALKKGAPEPVLEENWERLQGAMDEIWKRKMELIEQWWRVQGYRPERENGLQR